MPLDRGRLPGLVFVAVASFHFAAAWVGGPAPNWHGQTPEYFPLLTDAFLAGQTSLLVQPSAEMLALPDPYDPYANARYRLHDASLYHGKYYLYFGPTPALVLFLPYKVLTGWHLPSRIAVALFCTLGFAFSCALFFLLAKRERWDCPEWLGSAAVLSLGTAPGGCLSAGAPLVLRGGHRRGLLLRDGGISARRASAGRGSAEGLAAGGSGALLRTGGRLPAQLRPARRAHGGSGRVSAPFV